MRGLVVPLAQSGFGLSSRAEVGAVGLDFLFLAEPRLQQQPAVFQRRRAITRPKVTSFWERKDLGLCPKAT
jgi:hypothetical protein